MKKQLITAGASTLLAVVCFAYLVLSNDWDFYLAALIVGLVSAITAVALFVTVLVKYLRARNKGEGRKTNGYLVFAIVNVAIILGLVVVSVIDLLTATGFMAGLFGTLGLVYGVPIFCIPLAIDILLYFIYGRKKN